MGRRRSVSIGSWGFGVYTCYSIQMGVVPLWILFSGNHHSILISQGEVIVFSLTTLFRVQLQYPTSDYRITMIPIPIHDSLSGARTG